MIIHSVPGVIDIINDGEQMLIELENGKSVTIDMNNFVTDTSLRTMVELCKLEANG